MVRLWSFVLIFLSCANAMGFCGPEFDTVPEAVAEFEKEYQLKCSSEHTETKLVGNKRIGKISFGFPAVVVSCQKDGWDLTQYINKLASGSGKENLQSFQYWNKEFSNFNFAEFVIYDAGGLEEKFYDHYWKNGLPIHPCAGRRGYVVDEVKAYN